GLTAAEELIDHAQNLLDETQRILYRDMILENFALVASLVVVSSAEKPLLKGICGEVGWSPSLSFLCYVPSLCPFPTVDSPLAPTAGPITQKAYPCESCGPVLKDILLLTEPQGLSPRQKLYTCVACGRQLWFITSIRQHWKQHSREKHLRRDNCRTLFVKSSRVHLAVNPFTCVDAGKDPLASLSRL
ncbi:hypothetical protein HPG69_012595, partial [Diceros bicornis minor]